MPLGDDDIGDTCHRQEQAGQLNRGIQVVAGRRISVHGPETGEQENEASFDDL